MDNVTDYNSLAGLAAMLKPRKKSFLETSGNVASALAAGMRGQQYAPAKQDNTGDEFAKEIIKALILEKIKGKTTPWKPTTKEEFYELERMKAGLKPASRESLKSVAEGILPPENLPENILANITPSSLGPAEGGEVLAPPRSIFQGGEITSPEGGRIGEYLPGYEPKPFMPAVPGVLKGILAKTEKSAKPIPAPTRMQRTQTTINTIATKINQGIDIQPIINDLIDNREEFEANGIDVEQVFDAITKFQGSKKNTTGGKNFLGKIGDFILGK